MKILPTKSGGEGGAIGKKFHLECDAVRAEFDGWLVVEQKSALIKFSTHYPTRFWLCTANRGFHAGVFDSSGLTVRTLSLCERKGPEKVLRTM